MPSTDAAGSACSLPRADERSAAVWWGQGDRRVDLRQSAMASGFVSSDQPPSIV
jgi:hypothetical protein